MPPSTGKRQKGRVKKKSIKSKVTSAMGSKRKLSRMGKEQKKGNRGTVANYVTRGQALKRLQIPLKDFRRLCILKGIYPRDPKKKSKGKDKTYYHLKDIYFLSHEPLLLKFRDLKIFMKRVKHAANRHELSDARRRFDAAPSYSLDHLVRERYPSFGDALRDMDDALALVHLFAVLPAERNIKREYTVNCLRLVREWQNYVVRSHSLSKVFVSVKGVYFQAEVGGERVTWLQPHGFVPSVPSDVDFAVMNTFVEYYQIFLKFVLFRLYSGLGAAYPPAIDLKLDEAGAALAAVTAAAASAAASSAGGEDGAAEDATSRLVAGTSSGAGAGSSSSSSSSAKETATQRASRKRLSTVGAAIARLTSDGAGDDGAAAGGGANSDSGGGSEDDEDGEESGGGGLLGLESAFNGSAEATGVAAAAREAMLQRRLFHGLKIFLSREVPASLCELVTRSAGGDVGWDGPGSPFAASHPGITHHVVDKPTLGHRYLTREYVQPQWLLDSFNARFLLPTARYAPLQPLPPHLSPFVDDAAEGYTPAYAAEVAALKLAASGQRSAGAGADLSSAAVRNAGEAAAGVGGSSGDDSDDDSADGGGERHRRELAAEAAGRAFSGGDGPEENESDEDGDDGDDDEDDDDGDDDDDDDEDDDDDDENDNGEEEEDDEAPPAPVVARASGKKQAQAQAQPQPAGVRGQAAALARPPTSAPVSEEAEAHALALSMMGKKTKRLYDRMQHGLAAKRDVVDTLESKRARLEEEAKAGAKAAAAAAGREPGLKKMRTSESGSSIGKKKGQR